MDRSVRRIFGSDEHHRLIAVIFTVIPLISAPHDALQHHISSSPVVPPIIHSIDAA